MVHVHEHYRPTTDDYPPGVYRVVGTRDPAALLRVTDADGRRASTGHLERVPYSDLDDDFESVADPDAGIDPVRGLRNALQGLYWQVRKFL